MKKAIFLAPLALCALPAMAQGRSVSLLYSQITSRDVNAEGDVLSVDKSKGLALRYSQDILTLSPLGDARLAFEGTWMPKTGGQDLLVDGQLFGGGKGSLHYRHEYMGLGLSLAWTKVVDFGAALELRHEGNALQVEQGGKGGVYGQDLTRPWLSLRGGYTFQTGKMKPFLGVEFNLPLAKKETAMVSELDIAQNLNPKSQISLNAGLRF